ncbi:hypothetical protein LAZ67_7000944 [Cordylochernes scorpioides]|uniref:CCHC-type domain-containing protein n=1 Tax=Cordylochernes scorpioides TaxID=51811 RepID=A0ABY6KPS7_9ARAC|nr:hypothetical protein LAZ67_7000944 [Cordylochernes scorpioides]
MINYLSRKKTCSDHLREAGCEVKDEYLAYSMLAGIPDSYDGIIMNFENITDNEFTSSKVKQFLLTEHERRTTRKEDSSKEVLQIGHIAVNCRGMKLTTTGNRDNQHYQRKVNRSDNFLAALYLTSDEDSWLLDSGATNHVCRNKDWFVDLREVSSDPIMTAICKIEENGNRLTFRNMVARVFNLENRIIAEATNVNGLYIVKEPETNDNNDIENQLPSNLDSVGVKDTLPQPSTSKNIVRNPYGRKGKPRVELNLLDVTEPQSFEEAVQFTEAVYWRKAMDDEPRVLQERGTWELLTLPPGKKPISRRWVYKAIIAVYVDDLALFGESEEILQNIKQKINEKFRVKILGAIRKFLGVQIDYPDEETVVLSQTQFASNPGRRHWQAAKHVLRYSHGNINLSLVYRRTDSNDVCTYSDVDWASDIDDRRSNSGTAITIEHSLVIWKTSKQKPLKKHLDRYHLESIKVLIEFSLPLIINCDNRSAIDFSKNNGENNRSKHIEIRYHHVRDRIISGEIKIVYIPTKENLADIFTKTLSKVAHKNASYAQVSKIFSLRAIKNPSAKCLHEFMDVCNEAIRNLETLELKRNKLVDVILVHFLQQKLNENLRLDWELSVDNTLPSYDKFIAFISRHARSMSCAVRECSKKEETTGSRFPKCQSYGMLIEKSDTCILCKSKHHPLYMCNLFCKMPLKEKLNVVKGHKLCFNCLRKGHFSWNCRLNQRCKVCKGKHHTMIHYDKPSTEGASAQVENTTPKEHESAINLTNTQQANCNDSHVLLATAGIKIKNGLGKLCTCRALLDSGSQVTMITKECCERLGLVQRKSDRMIIGVGNTPVQHSSSTVSVTFCPLNNSEEFSVEAVVTGVLTSEIPNFRLKDPNWPTLKNLKLADPEFYIQAPIDMILGADIYTELMLNGSISLGEGLTMAINTFSGGCGTENATEALRALRTFKGIRSGKEPMNCYSLRRMMKILRKLDL